MFVYITSVLRTFSYGFPVSERQNSIMKEIADGSKGCAHRIVFNKLRAKKNAVNERIRKILSGRSE